MEKYKYLVSRTVSCFITVEANNRKQADKKAQYGDCIIVEERETTDWAVCAGPNELK